jgi:hypothetical protein
MAKRQPGDFKLSITTLDGNHATVDGRFSPLAAYAVLMLACKMASPVKVSKSLLDMLIALDVQLPKQYAETVAKQFGSAGEQLLADFKNAGGIIE